MKIYIAIETDWDCYKILGVYADETAAYVEGNAARSVWFSERNAPIGTIAPTGDDPIFINDCFHVEVYDVKVNDNSQTPVTIEGNG